MEPEQESEVLVEESPLSVWNTITPFSKYLAMILFIALPFIGGWVGYAFAPEKVVEVEKIVEIKRETVKSESLSYSVPDITGECFHNIERLEPVYTQVETNFLNQNPSYETLYRSWGVDKTKPKARSYSNALFGCELSNGNLMASFIYSNTNYLHNNPDEPRYRFRLIQFAETGNIVKISAENTAPSIGGTFEITNVNQGTLEFFSEVIDPCYSASHSYLYDLDSNALREVSEGGQIPDCKIPSPGSLIEMRYSLLSLPLESSILTAAEVEMDFRQKESIEQNDDYWGANSARQPDVEHLSPDKLKVYIPFSCNCGGFSTAGIMADLSNGEPNYYVVNGVELEWLSSTEYRYKKMISDKSVCEGVEGMCIAQRLSDDWYEGTTE